jgi:hypothetical protein
MNPDEIASRIAALTIGNDRDTDHGSNSVMSKSDGKNTMPRALSLAHSTIQSLVNDHENRRIHTAGPSESLHSSVAGIVASHQPLDAPSRKTHELIQAVEYDMQMSGRSLSFKDVPEDSVLQSLLDAATNVAKSSASSLALVKPSNPKVISHKASAIQILQSLESRINQLRTLLPAVQPRVFVDAGEFCLDPPFCSSIRWNLMIFIRSHPS